MAEEEDKPKENPPTPPGLERCQQRGAKGETAFVTFIVFSYGLCGDRQGWRWVIKHEPSVGYVPLPGLRSLVRMFLFSLRQSGGGAAYVSPLVKISFETMCLVIIFSF